MRKRRAIIFDDNEYVLSFFRDYFTLLNYEVLTFREPAVCPIYTGRAACARRQPCADIIITDYRMPGLNGADLLREQLRAGCRVPAENKAVLSADLEREVADSITCLGAAFFKKPVMLDRLSAWVAACERRMDPSLPLGDRRREERMPGSGQEWYQMEAGPGAIACSVLNVSQNGFCLNTPAPLEPGQLVHVTSRTNEFRAAVVCWSGKRDDGTHLAGLKCC